MAVHRVSLSDAEGQLAALVELAANGSDVCITRSDGSVIKLVVEVQKSNKRIAGLHQGSGAWVSDDFDAPLGDDFWFGDSIN
ncbi:MAG: prevent-host-death protein [Moraxellaceae bacterium]|nr:MAG: prevent-host-death protein [Moraxellaceae bacterium]